MGLLASAPPAQVLSTQGMSSMKLGSSRDINLWERIKLKHNQGTFRVAVKGTYCLCLNKSIHDPCHDPLRAANIPGYALFLTEIKGRILVLSLFISNLFGGNILASYPRI